MLRPLTLCLFTLFASQAAAQSLVGKWDCEGRDGPGTAIRTLQEYSANGLFYHRANLAMGNDIRRMDASVSLRGSWTLGRGVIVEDIRKARMTALKENGRDISRTKLGKRLGRDLPKRMGGRDGTSRTKIKFITADRFQITDGRIRGFCTRR